MQKTKCLAQLFGVSCRQMRRKLAKAQQHRFLIKSNVTGVSWVNVEKRKNTTKLSPDVVAALHKWLLAHPHVVPSPIAKDCLKIKIAGSKETLSTPKLLLQIPIRELHNDMIKSPDDGGLPEAFDANGNVIISDTTLRKLMPPQIKKMSHRHMIMCGCEVCIQASSFQASLNSWRLRHLHKLKDIQKSSNHRRSAASVTARLNSI